MKRRKFFRRMLMVQMIVALFYTASFSLINYFGNNSLANNNMDHESGMITRQITEYAENTMTATGDALRDLYENEYFLKYISGNNEYDFYNIKLLCDKMKQYSGSVAILGVSTLGNDIIVSDYGTYEFSQFIKKYSDEEIDREECIARIEADKNKNYLVLDSKSNILIIAKNLIGESKFIYSFEVYDKSELFHKLELGNNLDILLYMDGKVISSIGKLSEYEAEEISGSYIKNKTKWSNYRIYGTDSERMDWKYIYCFSNELLNMVMKGMVVRSIWMILIFELIGIILIYFSARRLYRPINKLLDSMKFHGTGDDTDEFTYMADLYRELNERNLRYEEIARYAYVPAKNKAIENILQGIVPKGKRLEVMKKNGIRCFDDKLVIVYIRIKCHDGNIDTDFNCILHEQIKSIIYEKMISNNIVCEIINIRLMNVITLCNGNTDRLPEILDELNAISENNYSSSVNCIISDEVFGVDEAREQYSKLLVTAESAMLDSVFVYYSDMTENDKIIDFYYPIELERDFVSAVVGGRKEQADKIIEQIIDMNMNCIKISNANVGFLRNMFAGTLIRIMQYIHRGEDRGLLKIFNVLRHTPDVNEMRANIFEAVDIISEMVRDTSDDYNKKMIADITDIIHCNYDKDISLAEMSYKFHVSQSHLSGLFKKYTGYNFKDYVNSEKIKKAKEILEKKDVKIKELSNMLGFNSVNTFIKVFKRYEGVSPGQYIKNRIV